MKFWRGQQKTEVRGEKARERKCQKPAVQLTNMKKKKIGKNIFNTLNTQNCFDFVWAHLCCRCVTFMWPVDSWPSLTCVYTVACILEVTVTCRPGQALYGIFWSLVNNNNNNIHISIVPQGCDFRGADFRSCHSQLYARQKRNVFKIF